MATKNEVKNPLSDYEMDAMWMSYRYAKPIWQIQGYVPNKLLPPYETGWGDYLEFIITPDGSLQEWRTPLNFEDFIEDDHEPKLIKTNKWYRAKRALLQVHNCSLNNEEMAWLIDRLTEEQN